ncbi:MAG: hypothetical protein LBS99_02235 [Clostridiales bacterium]|jgi:hypothetical protein|nr:hypothetical protein [Clostridiales bacterium]
MAVKTDKGKKRRGIFRCVALASLMALTGALGACGKPQTEGDYEGFDPAQRIDDARSLSAKEYSVLNTTALNDFGAQSAPKDGAKTDRERYTGMFYFLTLGQHNDHSGVYDISKILAQYGRAGFDGDFSYSPVGAAHFWGEPVFGYYDSGDPWVMRKQIEMLTFMNIDFLGLDVSNGVLYESVTDKLFGIIAEYRAQGWNAPQIMYYSGGGGNTGADRNNLKALYNKYYANPLYDDIWFAPEGKPMTVLLQSTAEAMAEAGDPEHALYEKFDVKYRQWPNEPDRSNGFPWIDFRYPQKVYKKTLSDKNGIVSVSVGQHITVRFSDTAGTRGRGWSPDTMANDHNRFAENLNFSAQWETVREKDAEIKYTFITGWNEWVATKMYRPDLNPADPYLTVDQYNDEFSRDLEPTRTGALKDNGFLLSHKEVRDYKLSEAKHYKYPELSPSLTDASDPAWNSAAVYEDFVGEAIARDYPRMDNLLNLTDDSNRNDIAETRVARDKEYLYFKVTCAANITAPASADKGWLNIHINTRNSGEKDALGYQYRINSSVSDGKGEILRALSDGKSEKAGGADIFLSGKSAVIRVPLSALCLSDRNYEIDFKVSDNVNQNNFLNFYTTGDCAPCGRLNYKFGY